MALRTKFGFAAVNHLYTDEEKQILQSYQSLEYLPPHSKVYRNWLQQQPARLDWDRWLMMGLIGFSGIILIFPKKDEDSIPFGQNHLSFASFMQIQKIHLLITMYFFIICFRYYFQWASWASFCTK